MALRWSTRVEIPPAELATALHSAAAVIRLLAFIEALGVTGTLRNLLEFAPGVELHLATYRRPSLGSAHSAGVDAMVQAARRQNVPVHVLEERHAFDPRLPFAARSLIGRIAPDIVETHNIKSHAIVAGARAACDVPWVAFHHGYTDTDLKVRVYNRVDRWSLRRADVVLTTCQPFAGMLIRHGVDAGRIRVVHNAAPPTTVPGRRIARERLSVASRAVVVGVGRLSREKGFDLLVDALGAMDDRQRAGILLVVAGDGPERRPLERQAKRLGVAARFDGHQPDVRPYYAAADAFVLPSRSEGSPNALLEAMAAGCPIVAARAGGVPELVDHHSAVLVPAGQVEPLRHAIARLVHDGDLARHLGGRARMACARFTRERRSAQLLAIYGSLLPARAAACAR